MLLLEILKWSFRGVGWRPCPRLQELSVSCHSFLLVYYTTDHHLSKLLWKDKHLLSARFHFIKKQLSFMSHLFSLPTHLSEIA